MLTTFQQHIVQEQTLRPGSPVELQWLMSAVILASKLIQAQVRRAGLGSMLGSFDEINPHGEEQQKLDVYANETMIKCFSLRESVGVIASEEVADPIVVHKDSPLAQYAIVFDPLDGSSNIDVAVTIGTTFSILKRPPMSDSNHPLEWVLQSGRCQVAAGYVLYGSSTVLVYSMGNGVHGFTLDPSIGSYVLSHENIRMPEQGQYYSINEAYDDQFPARYVDFINSVRTGAMGKFYSSRFVGSMVADFHRTLLRGGIFLYPETPGYPGGRLRLLYEANPIAFIAEQAGGRASDGTRPILDICPDELHQRTPLVVGGKSEMDFFEGIAAASV